MARMNISISEELKVAMEGLNCNWSAIAQAAFINAVEIEQLKGEGKLMEAGIARLRVSKQANVQQERNDGFIHGQNWALEDSSYEELKEIANMHDWAIKNPERQDEAIELLTKLLNQGNFDLPGLPQIKVSINYAMGYLEGAAKVFSKV